MMKYIVLLAVSLILSTFANNTNAQIPTLIRYQGRVTVSGTNFNGTGQFKFALVDDVGSFSFWSNDGSSIGGSQPTSTLSLDVTNGLFSALLGDPELNMVPISPDFFTNSDIHLRIWFNDGPDGFSLLTPDQSLASVGYAMRAKSASLATTVPDGSITGTKLATATITSANLAPGAVAENLAAAGQSGFPSGGIVISTSPNPTNLLSAGYVPIGSFPANINEDWEQRSNATAPSARLGHDAIWTGTEMIVWGGANASSYFNNGGRYNPSSNTWLPMATNSSIAPRRWFPIVWTGSDMLIWGGYNNGTYLNDGWRYKPVSDSWTALSSLSNLPQRDGSTAVWTGTEMLVWGGYQDTNNYFATGSRYNPVSNTWTLISTANAPDARIFHTAIWTGTEMLIWGGLRTNCLSDGARYNPASNTWTPISNVNAPLARKLHTAIWTGTEMIVWGGTGNSNPLNDGGRYNPATDTWTPLSLANAPQARNDHTAVWTGTEMIIWGGNYSGPLQGGGIYNPATDSWRTITTAGGPSARHLHSAVWTGSQMLIWGGEALGTYYNDLYSYTPSRNLYLFQKP